MRRGSKIFVFMAAMLLTVGGMKAAMGHRYGHMHSSCHNERFEQGRGMNHCHKMQTPGTMVPGAQQNR